MVVGFKCKYTKQSREEDCGEKLCDLSSSSPLSFLFQTEILSTSQGKFDKSIGFVRSEFESQVWRVPAV